MKNLICRSLILILMPLITLVFLSGGPALATGDPDEDPQLEALPLAPPIPTDNPSGKNVFPSPMDEKQELGYLLYFDPKLSGDTGIACSDCHDPKQGWGFSDPICRGYPGAVHWRNCQTVVNTGYLDKIFWEGSVTKLEDQAPGAAQGAVSGNGSNDMMESRLRFTPDYVKRFRDVYGAEWPHIEDAWKAISAFERYLSQPNTPYDNFLRGDKSALSAKAQKGLELFKGKANCAECHNGFLTSDQKFYDIGVPDPPEFEEDGIQQVTYRFELYAKGSTEEFYRHAKSDPGIYFKQKRKEDMGKFRTPPLRYLKYTAPYMHNGTMFTLEEVIDFYNDGGGVDRWGNKTKIMKPLNLTDDEKEALVELLLAMSGEEIILPVPKVPDYAPMADWQPKK